MSNVEAAKGVEIEKGRTSATESGNDTNDAEQWTLYMDDASNKNGLGATTMLISPEGHKIHRTLCYGFQVSNNAADYQALIMGFQSARELRVCNLKIYSDSQLVVNQVNDVYQVRGEKMVAYLGKAKELLRSIQVTLIEVVPRSKNTNADTLAKLASTRDAELLDAVSVEFLAEPSIKQRPEVMELEQKPSWMDPIVVYVKNGELPENKTEARVLRLKVARYVLYEHKLYRRGYSMPLLKCVTPPKAEYIMREIHEDIYGNHARGQSLAFKVLRKGITCRQ